MDAASFVSAFGEYEKSIPFTPETVKKSHALRKAMFDAASPEHIVEIGEFSYGSDEAHCQCGWKSVGYWDGMDLAERDWRNHVIKEISAF
jgi:hypothetical protein